MAERILVIEDDQPILETVTEILESGGYQVIGLPYPELVLEVVDHERPDLILLDVMLPRSSGVEVADRLWMNGFGSTPLIAMSASNVMVDLARQTPFFDRVIRKPFDMEPLLRQVRDVLNAHDPTCASPVAELSSLPEQHDYLFPR